MVGYNINMINTIKKNLDEHKEVFDQLGSLEVQIAKVDSKGIGDR